MFVPPVPAAPPKRRAADIAYDRIETLISRLALRPGAPIVETEIGAMTGLGRTPVREALMRMISVGLIVQQPRRGLRVSDIDVLDHLNLLETRRVLERLIAEKSARRATDAQRAALLVCADRMIDAAEHGSLDDYTAADQALDHVNHAACRNVSAVGALAPLVVHCRRFWYAYQAEGDVVEGAHAHRELAAAIASGEVKQAIRGADRLLDYLEQFARKVIEA